MKGEKSNSIVFYDILDLVEKTYIPFMSTISDDDIEASIQCQDFVKRNLIYKELDLFTNKRSHVSKIATIAYEIITGKYNFNKPILIWQDGDYIDFDGIFMYHIRAFYFCNQNIPAKVLN
jgi:hypothetical protein